MVRHKQHLQYICHGEEKGRQDMTVDEADADDVAQYAVEEKQRIERVDYQ